jgi:hypothetical protein
MKVKPINIKYTEIVKNKAIRYKTDITGFMLLITNILDMIDKKLNISK